MARRSVATRRGRLGTGLVAAVCLAGAWGCARNPATGEREFSLIGEAQEIQMGREADPQIVASLGLYPDESLQRYVQALGEELAAASERPDLPWTFRVLDDPTVNAFALPGGFIYVTRGILSHLTSEAELAGVLGHEIGHVTARHSVSQISRAQLTQLGVGIGMILVPELQQFAPLANVGLQLLALRHGRDDELEADGLGIRYMTRESYAPTELADVMAVLESASRQSESSGRVPEWLSTHPNPENRIARIEATIAETPAARVVEGATVVGRDEYLRRIDGIVFGTNPREGFFQGDLFLHPDLAFRLEFPTGWSTVNGKQAVQGVSPNQDAALVLTLGEGTPRQSLATFADQQNVRVLGSSERSINGLSAVLADFAAATEGGTVVGQAAFISHGGRTYQLLGYTPEGRWSSYSRAIGSALGSFQRLTDARVLELQPRRLDLVSLPRSMSVDEFRQRYDSSVGADVLALINHVAPGGTLAGGSLVKRVVGGS